MSDLFDLLLEVVHWWGRTGDRVLDGIGLEGGWLDRAVAWLAGDGDIYVASGYALVLLVLWTILWAILASWVDRRARARLEGRMGPRHRGLSGMLQELIDLVKLKLKKRPGMPSAAPAAFALALILAALAILPLGPWGRLTDPTWGLMVASALVALSALPTALASPRGRRIPQVAEAAGTGVVLLLAMAPMVLLAGSGRAGDVVDFQASSGPGMVLAPLALLLHMMVMHWESVRLSRCASTGRPREGWPGPHMAMARFVGAARYYSLGVLGAVVFLGGWWGPGLDGWWWTVAKAFVLITVVSLLGAAMPVVRPGETAHAIRRRWLPVAAIDLVMVAGLLEVMA